MPFLNRRSIVIGSSASLFAPSLWAQVSPRFITVVMTTSTQDSGLLAQLGPVFTAQSGIGVRFISMGSGQALDTGRRGDADVVFSHIRVAEEEFVAAGYGVKRWPIMYNDFVLVGPSDDPAGIKGMASIAQALNAIRQSKSIFVSRGDRSGTHFNELTLWSLAGVDIERQRANWYREIGQGMGATLNLASTLGGYTLTDRGTWLSFRNRGNLGILVQGDPSLRNQYGAILVNPTRHAHIKSQDGQAFIDWLVSSPGQATIADYKINGQQLFFPNAQEQGA